MEYNDRRYFILTEAEVDDDLDWDCFRGNDKEELYKIRRGEYADMYVLFIPGGTSKPYCLYGKGVEKTHQQMLALKEAEYAILKEEGLIE